MKVFDLIREREILIAYLESKMKTQDWHGVADAAMDLREVDARIEVFKRTGRAR